jgi:HAD superfamily hydrolase (TIGR01509 family)
MAAIQAVTFDLWETLIHDVPERGAARSRRRIERMTAVLRHLRADLDEARVAAAYERSAHQYDVIWREQRDLTTRRQLEILIDLLDEGLVATLDATTWDALERAYVEPIHETPPLPGPHTLPVLDWLAQHGYRLGLISNTGRTPGVAMRRLLATYGLLDRFAVTIFSNEEGLLKPRRELFERAAERLGLPPAQIVHVGDNPVADVAGAKAAGMRAILLGGQPASVLPDAQITTLAELPPALQRLDPAA